VSLSDVQSDMLRIELFILSIGRLLIRMLNIIKRLIGKKVEDISIRDVASLVEPLKVPAIHVMKTDATSLSHFGGMPNLPPDMEWPERNGRKLSFLARLSLSEMRRTYSIDWLPSTGALLFFYDIEEQPWGFDPQDRGSSAVLMVPDLAETSSPQHEIDGIVLAIPHRNISFQRIEVIPSWERNIVRALEFNDKEDDLFFELDENTFQGEPKHQVAGFPSPVQGDDMELECQLVTNGLYCGNVSGYQDERAEALKPGAKNWRLLFQIDSDDEINTMWGDCGTIYYWIEEHAARKGDFTNTWLILQCA
jgi:uncharacterized protein YwqG